MIFDDKYKYFKPSTFRGYVMTMEKDGEHDVEHTENDVKVYSCEGCCETFTTPISKATRYRVRTDYVTWKDGQGEPTSREHEDVEKEEESV